MLKYKVLSLISYFIFIPVFFISALFLIIISLIYLPLFYKLDKFFCRLIMLTFFIWPKINGTFPVNRTYIIMMNHSSFIDVFLFPLIPLGKYSGIAAENNFYIPIFGTLFKRIHAIPIQRNNLKSAILSIKQAEQALEKKIHIGILPEGTRTITGKMNPLKKGGFHMAKNTHAPILPVGINGAFTFKPKNRWWIIPNKISINIGNPIETSEYSHKELQNAVTKQLKLLSNKK